MGSQHYRPVADVEPLSTYVGPRVLIQYGRSSSSLTATNIGFGAAFVFGARYSLARRLELLADARANLSSLHISSSSTLTVGPTTFTTTSSSTSVSFGPTASIAAALYLP